jgi:hypothetical protein
MNLVDLRGESFLSMPVTNPDPIFFPPVLTHSDTILILQHHPITVTIQFSIPDTALFPQKTPPPPGPLLCSCCILPTYCLLTVFHAAIYFSMHREMHVVSPLANEVPGLVTHLSKQCSFTFYQVLGKNSRVTEKMYLDQLLCIRHSSFLANLLHHCSLGILG